MTIRKSVVFCLILVLVGGFVFTACKKKSGPKQIVIGYAAPTLNNPFWLALEQGVKAVLEPQGIKVVDFHADNDQSIQNDKIRDLLGQNIDALLLAPRDSTGVREALQACAEKKVPIVIFDTPLITDQDKALVISTVASDNYNAGVVVAKDMMSRLPRGSSIVIMHSPAAGSCIPRYDGFVETANGYFNILQVYDGEGAIDKTMPKAEDALQSYPSGKLQAIYCINDPSAEGAVRAIESAGRQSDGILVYGIDGAPNAKKMIKEGKMTGTGAQSPMGIGKRSAEIALQVLRGDTNIPKDIPIETFIINKENVDKYGIDNWQ
ncbi:sugar ABC transporter substrate-binding protein [Treponema primitia]|uniref:sugar ABC transporter substrate-binding protein n=1 Tax=Treponema primitia TaxID=88058 RepID=UPI00397F0F05